MQHAVRLDLVSLFAGTVTTALGALVLLDSTDAIELTLGWMAVVLTAAVGAILLLSGLVRRPAGRHD